MSSAPLTIVHVVFSSHIAGGEQYCIDLAQAQQALGHEVHVVGPSRSAIAGALAAGITYHGLALPLLRGARLRRLARRLDADVCHGHLGPACKAVAQMRGCVRIGTLHVGYKPHQHAQLDGLICVNRAQGQQLARYEGAYRTIYNWAPLRPAAPAGTDLRAELGLSPAQLLVGGVGRLHPSKGMDLLVAAFRAHAPQDAVLAILGEGKQRAELERLAGGDARIRLLGFRRDVDAALQAMDLFVSPSREEAFPLAILEAMRAGLPILATETQGPREMLREQPSGDLLPVGNVPALGRALEDALVGLRRQGHHGQRPRIAYALEAYQRDEAVRQVLSFYAEVQRRGQPLAIDAVAAPRQAGAHV
ncbi:glycosyltransferase [Roseateles violae]|uniref:Glycosyltransferase n=1 Tax=Roseateles violae TaxID=3058042 RepID=A0ABT8DT14_9BURK|nr:glycosyltransferase [Pelomonas sp. PFR6]MDN3919306.1 glycosyltransferase [Pelomonas sp. PFR6]